MEKQIKLSGTYEDHLAQMDRKSHMVGVSMWDFEWCPKYRYNMFRKWKYMKLVEACIRRAASLHDIKWIELSVQPNHVQGTAAIPLNMTPSKAMNFVKGISLKLFFEKCPNARKRYPKGHLWSPGKYAASIGFVQIDVVNEYIKNQDKHHGTVWIMEK
jgi:putative transposase